MSNPFLTLPAFDQSQQSQIDFFDGLKTIVNQLESTQPIIIDQSTVPTQVQMETLYLAAGVGRTLPVPTSQEFIWTWQGVVQGEYRTLDDLVVNVNDTNVTPLGGIPGFQYLMANGDIVSSILTRYDPTVATTSLVTVDRRLGTLGNIALTTIGTQFSANPAGTKLAYTALDGGGKNQIFTCTYPALGSVTQLTTSATGASLPHWVGTKIAYVDAAGGVSTIKIMNDNGTSQTTVVNLGAVTVVTLQLSPDQTKIIHSRVSAAQIDVYLVNVNGTGLVKFIDHASSTDNPNGDMSQVTAPSWHPSGLWIYFGRRRKNINTNAVEQWFTLRVQPPDTTHSLTDSMTLSSVVPYDWYTANLVTTNYYNSQAEEDTNLLVPTFSNFILNGQVIITGLAVQTLTVSGSKPILMIASQTDGYTSTGKIYKTSQYVPDRGDFELIRTDLTVGGETSFSLSKAEIKDFSHLYFVINGANSAGGAITIKIVFNEDNVATHYQNTNVFATTALVRAYQTFGDDAVVLRGSGANGVNGFSAIVFIADIQAADAFKTALTQMVYTASAAAFAIANYFEGDLLSLWESVAPIESIRIVVSSALAANSIFSYYGLRGTPRNEKDI